MPAEPAIPRVGPSENPIWGEDWAEVRDLWPLEPTVAHLNHGSYGAVPTAVLEEQASWRQRMESQPGAVLQPGAAGRPGRGTGRGGRLPRAPTRAARAFVRNATTAVSTVLASFPLEAGQTVLLTDHAYGAVRIAAERFAGRAGARVEVVHLPLDEDDAAHARRVLDAAGPDTRLVVLEQVTSPTARRLPLVELVPALQDRGVAVLVDGAHAPGMLAVEVDRLGADFWVGNLHKWCLTPRGTALLNAAPRWRPALLPLVASWGEGDGFPDAFADIGTDDMTAWLSAPRALRVLERLGLDRLRRHNAELAVAGQRIVAEALQLDPAALPRDPAVSMQLVPLPDGLVRDTARGRRAAQPDRRGGRRRGGRHGLGGARLPAPVRPRLQRARRLPAARRRDLPALL